MNDRPTPETDSLINSWDASRLEKFPFAFVAEAQALMMRLERERDEAREFEAENALSVTSLCKAVRDLRKQLTESRAQAERLAEALEQFMGRVYYNTAYIDGKPRGASFNTRPLAEFDAEVESASAALAAYRAATGTEVAK